MNKNNIIKNKHKTVRELFKQRGCVKMKQRPNDSINQKNIKVANKENCLSNRKKIYDSNNFTNYYCNICVVHYI